MKGKFGLYKIKIRGITTQYLAILREPCHAPNLTGRRHGSLFMYAEPRIIIHGPPKCPCTNLHKGSDHKHNHDNGPSSSGRKVQISNCDGKLPDAVQRPPLPLSTSESYAFCFCGKMCCLRCISNCAATIG